MQVKRQIQTRKTPVLGPMDKKNKKCFLGVVFSFSKWAFNHHPSRLVH
jgi:hypothetical protein